MKNALIFLASMLLCLGAYAQPDSSTLILRANPYLQNPTSGGISVCWQTNLPSYSFVQWSTDTTKTPIMARTLVAGQAMANNHLNKIRINGLEGGQKYYYRIVSKHIRTYQAYKKEFGGTYTSPYYSFTLPADNQNDFQALIFNDLHQHSEVMDALINTVRDKKLNYDIVFFNGDCIDDPKDEEQAVTMISKFNAAIGSTDKPVIYMRGNHEIRNAYSLELTNLFDYAGGQSYGAMNWGTTRIVMLDCGEDKPDSHWVYYSMNDFTKFRADQLDFLKKEHSNPAFKKASKRILIHHIPLWGLEDDPDSNYNPCLELWGKEISAQPYAVAINGHTHQTVLHKKGAVGNPFPVAIGGGPQIEGATVIHMVKNGDKLTLTSYNTKGEVVWSLVV